ncbi:MAG: hypothetical protein H7Z39_18155 [Burkholderiaceae bacterium]|nr:hypothetical protein [Burkholderiaceae bacterium]
MNRSNYDRAATPALPIRSLYREPIYGTSSRGVALLMEGKKPPEVRRKNVRGRSRGSRGGAGPAGRKNKTAPKRRFSHLPK